MQAPGVMVSSTFYDLKQHRANLQHFLQDELGYRALLSETPSFPINPDLSTIDNCRQRVERDADVMVLVIGRRYGSLDDHSAKSITNLEYLAARQKGIPVYAFLDRGIQTLMNVWRGNPAADFSKEVDSVRLFDFVEQVLSTDRVWVQEFDRAQEIIDALRIQFAYRQHDGLTLARRFRGVAASQWLDRLSGDTLRVALEHPAAWEYRLFAGALTDGIGRHVRLRRRHEMGIPLGLGEDIDDPLAWVHARFRDAMRLGQGMSALINDELQQAFGPSGTSGDGERIVFAAESLTELYGDALRWADRIRTANIDEMFAPVLEPLSRFLDDAITQVEGYGPQVTKSIREALDAKATGEPRTMDLTLTIAVPASVKQRFTAALEEIQRAAGI